MTTSRVRLEIFLKWRNILYFYRSSFGFEKWNIIRTKTQLHRKQSKEMWKYSLFCLTPFIAWEIIYFLNYEATFIFCPLRDWVYTLRHTTGDGQEGSISSMCLCAAFTRTDPESTKKHKCPDCHFSDFGIWECESCMSMKLSISFWASIFILICLVQGIERRA